MKTERVARCGFLVLAVVVGYFWLDLCLRVGATTFERGLGAYFGAAVGQPVLPRSGAGWCIGVVLVIWAGLLLRARSASEHGKQVLTIAALPLTLVCVVVIGFLFARQAARHLETVVRVESVDEAVLYRNEYGDYICRAMDRSKRRLAPYADLVTKNAVSARNAHHEDLSGYRVE